MATNDWRASQYDRCFGFVSDHGQQVVDLLDPRSGESILDLGCGTGHLTAEIASRGADVLGVDPNDSMLQQARANYPRLRFATGDVLQPTTLPQGKFDAVFSNAVLHWVHDQASALANLNAVMRTGGRLVAEMGGVHNVEHLLNSVAAACQDLGLPEPEQTNFFPTPDQQTNLLEEAGFEVQSILWFRRPTPLQPGQTAASWAQHFRTEVWSLTTKPDELAQRIDDYARAAGLESTDGWIADYCRLRFVAVKL